MTEFATPRRPTAEGLDRGPTASPRTGVPSRPGRPLDHGTRTTMEARFAHDFSRVRVHTDPDADRTARSLGAAAVTTGSDIAFAAGRYRPDSTVGRRLLAHELAHVVQQAGTSPTAQRQSVSTPGDAAEQAADAAASGFGQATPPAPSLALGLRDVLRDTRSRPGSVLRAVTSWAGDFDTDKYDTITNKAGTKIGVDMELRFKPGTRVDAEKIGMVQMVTSRDVGSVVALNATVGARSIPTGNAGEGAHIDRLANRGNPVFATGAAAAGDTLADTAMGARGRHGWRFTDKSGTVQSQDALLKDKPKLSSHGANASQVFESTALALKGVQQGTWYGSVQWGWRTDATNTFTKLPLTLVSRDVPSPTFSTAAGLWNANPTSTGAATIGLPMILGKYTKVPGVWLLRDPSRFPAGRIGMLRKNTRLEVTDKAPAATFNSDKTQMWWKVTVTEGVLRGRVGWVMEANLSDSVTP